MKDSFDVLDVVLTNYFKPYVQPHITRAFHADKAMFIHSLHVACLSVQLGDIMGMSGKQLDNLAAGALLHDIGKLDISPEILNKPCKLTGEERLIVNEHSKHGFIRIQETVHPSIIDYICLFHHYYLNGTGYPKPEKEYQDFFRNDDLKGRVTIPMEVQIVTIADIFCALTSPRCYKGCYSYKKAIWKLKRMRDALNQVIVEELEKLVRNNSLLLNTSTRRS